MGNHARKILVLSRAVVGQRMSGPGIRSYQIARVLAEQLPEAEVTLGVPAASDLPTEALPFRIETYTSRSLGRLARSSDVMIAFTFPLGLIPSTTRTHVVLDLYGVFLPEWLEVANTALKEPHRQAWMAAQRHKLSVLLTWADFVLYANERQRHLYLGMLATLGRITPEAYANDRELSGLLGYAPFGVRPGEPTPTRRALKGVWPGIRPTDKVLIWNGAVVEWYDLTTLIRAVHRLSRERDDIKLFFMGTELPSAQQRAEKLQGQGAGVVREALRLCEELGLLDKYVFFNFDWVSYEETVNYLMDADAGVCTYHRGLETEFSFRTRLLDLFWTARPIVCTQGDVLADLVDRRTLGVAVPPADEDALVRAIKRVIDDESFVAECKRNLREVREEFRWERTLHPLVEFCRNPVLLGPSKKSRLFPLGLRLGNFAWARAWQLLTTRTRGPRYL